MDLFKRVLGQRVIHVENIPDGPGTYVKNDILKVVNENVGEFLYKLSIGKGFLPITHNPVQ